MTEEQTIAYLIQKTGGMLVMTPKQLATVIPCSENQQSLLRVEGRFPIRYSSDFGDRVFYSVPDVAAYILYGKVTGKTKEPDRLPVVAPSEPEPTPRKRRGRKALPVEDLSHKLLLRGFVAKLQQEAQELQIFADNMARYEKSFLLKEKLTEDLLSDDDADDSPQKTAI